MTSAVDDTVPNLSWIAVIFVEADSAFPGNFILKWTSVELPTHKHQKESILQAQKVKSYTKVTFNYQV